MTKWLKLWPLFMLIALTPIATLFHSDTVQIPYFRSLGFQGWLLFLVVGCNETIQMVAWYVGWGRISTLIKEWYKEDINFAKKVGKQMRADGYVDWLKVYFARRHEKFDNKLNGILKAVKIGGWFTMFGFGLWPIWGPRMLGDFLCGTTRWRAGLIALCIGNLIKTVGFIFAWNGMFKFFGW